MFLSYWSRLQQLGTSLGTVVQVNKIVHGPLKKTLNSTSGWIIWHFKSSWLPIVFCLIYETALQLNVSDGFILSNISIQLIFFFCDITPDSKWRIFSLNKCHSLHYINKQFCFLDCMVCWYVWTAPQNPCSDRIPIY